MADDWKYDIEDFEDTDDGENDSDGDSVAAVGDSDGGRATDIFGENTSTNIEPGSPTFENALFVSLGVALALLVILGV